MNSTTFNRVAGVLMAGALVASCSKSPVNPSGSVTVTSPAQLAPANGAQIANLSQPVSLTVSNALVTDTSAGVIYTFEVSTDASFASKIQTKTASPGANGQTSVALDTLPPGQTYFWHTRATGGDTPGAFSSAVSFVVGPAISLGAPSVVAPLTGATPSGWPIFTVKNATKAGPVGAITYRFEVNTNAAFTGTTLLSQTVSEGSTQTTFLPALSTPVPTGSVFWRVTALDTANSIASPPSAVQNIVLSPLTTQARLAILQGQTLFPGIQPPGTNGHAVLGDNWDLQTLVSFDGVRFVSPTIEELQEFDLIDRGMDPGDAVNWLNTHGYPNTGLWVPAVQAVGYSFEYMALIFGAWNLIVRIGA